LMTLAGNMSNKAVTGSKSLENVKVRNASYHRPQFLRRSML